jgi:hypothetical protein
MIAHLLAAVMLFADAAAAVPEPPALAPMAAKPKLTKIGMICRNESVIGSKLPKRVCLTPEEDAARKARDRELTEYMQHSTRVGCGAAIPGQPCAQ